MTVPEQVGGTPPDRPRDPARLLAVALGTAPAVESSDAANDTDPREPADADAAR